MHLPARIIGVLCLLALATAGSQLAPRHVSAASDVVGHVYVNGNTAGTNTIAGFDRHADGTLTALPGSPFAAGGVGGIGLGSQGALQPSADGRYLLAVDAASNQISVLRIQPDGSLQLAEGSPVSSGGLRPVSIAVHGDLVYVANQGDVPNLTGFTLNPGGHLSALGNSTASLPTGSNPGDVLFNGTGTNLIVALVGHNNGPPPIDGALASYTVGADGRLTAANGSPFTAQANGPFGSAFRPTDPSQLFVANAHAGAGQGSVSAYSVAGDGALNAIGSPVANGQSGTCWATISPNGQYLFAVDTGTSTISSYAIAANGSLSLVGNTAIKSPSGLANIGATDARLDPSGTFLYVDEGRQDAVAIFQVSGGALTELSSSPVSAPAGTAPAGIVVN